jgi:tetratricopeptide (TPR) repeat protein
MLFSGLLRWTPGFHQATVRDATSYALTLLALAGISSFLRAQDDLGPKLGAAEVQLDVARSTLDETALIAVQQIFERCIQQSAARSRCYYDLGRTDSYLVDIKECHRDKQGALQSLDSAIENTQRSINLDGSFADAHALLADLYGRKIGYGGMLTGMRLGPKADTKTKRTLQLDPNDPRIYAVLGRRQLYSPRIFGGDIDKAIDSFRKSTKLDPHYDESFVWLAIAYAKKGDSNSAKAAVDEALRLNNRNVIAQELRSTMK